MINVESAQVDCCIAVQLTVSLKTKSSLYSTYKPYECPQNGAIYMDWLGFFKSFSHENQFTSVCDMIADLSNGQPLFAKHMLQFCDYDSLILSGQLPLTADSYSYLIEAWHITSWLDHCISTTDAHAALQSMETRTDHMPFAMTLGSLS